MGGGEWTKSSFSSYVSKSYTTSLDHSGRIDLTNATVQDMFKSVGLSPDLNPRNVLRECRDSEEHPETVPVILALDVTGSMGEAAVEVAKSLNVIMEQLYKDVKDVEFLVMGIGDLYCDRVPIQMGQFESDIRIAEQLDKIYFEFGGGGNYWESYTAAWYMGLHHTDLDCWKKKKKGIIITLGDERLNPILERREIEKVVGDSLQADVDTKELYSQVSEKYDVYHIHVLHGREFDIKNVRESWKLIGGCTECNINEIPGKISDIVSNGRSATNFTDNGSFVSNGDGISW